MKNCECTPAEYLPMENQWEPAYTCKACEAREEALYIEAMEQMEAEEEMIQKLAEWSGNPVKPISQKHVPEPDFDDLPF